MSKYATLDNFPHKGSEHIRYTFHPICITRRGVISLLVTATIRLIISVTMVSQLIISVAMVARSVIVIMSGSGVAAIVHIPGVITLTRFCVIYAQLRVDMFLVRDAEFSTPCQFEVNTI